jgi:hypothetical protein
MLGMTVAAGAIVPVGCAPLITTSSTPGQTRAAAPTETTTAGEDELCAAALSSRSARDVEALLRMHPTASCIPAMLNAMPTATLVAVSPAVLGTMPGPTRARLSARVERDLRFPFALAGGADSSGGGGSGGGGGGGPY